MTHRKVAPTRRAAVVAVAGLLLAGGAVPSLATGPNKDGVPATRAIVFNGEENRLWVYDSESFDRQTLIPSANDAETKPEVHLGLDINAQICTYRDGDRKYFIAGEDTFQDGGPVEGEPGWGWFELIGDEVGGLEAIEHGKLIPDWAQEEGQENYGCGFLPNGDLLLSDVGDQTPEQPANGQLHLWLRDEGDENGGFDDPTDVDVAHDTSFGGLTDPKTPGVAQIDNRPDDDLANEQANRYCMIDRTVGTAGGIAVHDGWAYVASNRPDQASGEPGGIYRYEIADFVDLREDLGPCAADRNTDLVAEGIVTRELWLPNDAFVPTPSALTPSGREVGGFPTWYVSSVFSGVIAEYVDTGVARIHLRNVVEPPGGAPIGQVDDLPLNDGGTPYGVTVTPDGNLWYADLGIAAQVDPENETVGFGPVNEKGSLQRVAIDSHGSVIQRVVVQDGLTYPDGVGYMEFDDPPDRDTDGNLEVEDHDATSESECDSWSMYGRGRTREFAVPDECESPITALSAPTLAPKWFVKTAKTVTASPAVFDNTVYVGDWSRTMYAVDAGSGAVRWTKTVDAAPGAAFGPIVSSAAVTDVRFGKKDTGRLVIFGAGPHLYALRDAGSTALEQWRFTLDSTPNTVVEIESSPVVWKGVVYVGFGNHNNPGRGVPGGLLALDAKTGRQIWRFEPELGADAGCGTAWSSPVINDTVANKPLVYLATANCTSDESAEGGFEWTPHTEAVTALDARNGEVVWNFQPHEPNRRDEDFGATGNLFEDEDGRLVFGIGNKDGVYYALDPRTGALLWKTKAAEPGNVQEDFAIGGFIGSTAAYGGNVFGGTAIGGPPYYHSLAGTTGATRWVGAQPPTYAASAVVNGVVFTAASDSMLRAYDERTGGLLAARPLAGSGSSGPAIVGNSVYVGSGTSSSDACAKDTPPISDPCLQLFDTVLGSMGGIHAFQVIAP